MTYGVYALGAAMVAVGLVFISHGVPIVRMELGWTEIMGGSVAASAGCIVLVLGLCLQHLEAMRDAMERLTLPLPAAPPQSGLLRPTFGGDHGGTIHAAFRPVHPLAPAARPHGEDEEVRPEPALTAALHPAEPAEAPPEAAAEPPAVEPVLPQSAPALAFAEQEEEARGPAVIAPDPVADPLAEPPTPPIRANFLAAFLARRAALPSAEPSAEPPSVPLSFDSPAPPAGGRPVIPSRRTSIDLSSGWDDEPAGKAPPLPAEPAAVEAPSSRDEPGRYPSAAPAPEASAVVEVAAVPSPVEPAAAEPGIAADPPRSDDEPDVLQPVVVGRYNAGAASYVMYSNGMIEVETEQGTHQFASMQDLKAFIERRDAQVS